MKRGFTLVELAIVIVIAGILAAVAIPIYQGIVEKSKWSEGKTACGSIRQSAEVIKAENSGDLTNWNTGDNDYGAAGVAVGGPGYNSLGIDPEEYNGQHFNHDEYTAVNGGAAGTYTITLTAQSTGAAGPPNPPAVADTYTLDQDGTAGGTAP